MSELGAGHLLPELRTADVIAEILAWLRDDVHA